MSIVFVSLGFTSFFRPMRIFILTICFCFVQFGTANAQSKKSKKLFEKARESDKEGDQTKAIEYLDKAIEKSPEYVEAYLFAADIYKTKENFEMAVNYYESLSNNYEVPYYFYLFYGEVLFEIGRYDDAVVSFREYLKSNKAASKYKEKVRTYIANCEFSKIAQSSPKPFDPVNLGGLVNSKNMEYFPSISADGNSLVFTYRAPNENKSDEDFFISVRDTNTGEWTQSKPAAGFLNTQLNEGAQTITSDGNIIYFAACERQDGFGSCDIYASFYKGNGQWTKAINLGPKVNSRVWDTQPSISSDGKTLYFVRASHGRAKNKDIYYTELQNNGRWAEAKKLEGPINTKGNETSPFIHFDNKTLYFSSDGHPGLGELDFFVSRKKEDGTWGKPENLGYPINSKEEDFSLIVSPDGKTAYFSSERLEDNLGLQDLYSFILPKDSRAIEIAYIKGRITNKVTGAPISAKIEFSELKSSETILLEESNKRGDYFSVLPGNTDYGLNIQKKGFLVYSKNFSLSDENVRKAYILNVRLIPIAIDQKVKLENVFYATASFELDVRSNSELNKVADFLNDNPSVKISIEGHTDNEGSKSGNIRLSKNRATSVYQYLITKGIDKSRLSTKGFGSSEPVADNETEEGRKRNRRTEIRITSYGNE